MSTEPVATEPADGEPAATGSAYPVLDLAGGATSQTPSFPALEETVLQRWDERDTFRESIRNRADAQEYVF